MVSIFINNYLALFCRRLQPLCRYRRLDYTVIGDVVNTAQRLQSAAKECQIIINEDAYHKIKESFNCNKIGEVSLKNKKGLSVIYEVLN